MNRDHWILLGGWIGFALLHSVLAAPGVKAPIQRAMGRYSRYYTLSYSGVATISLAGILAWQYTIPSPVLGPFPILKYVAGLIAGVPGLWLMGICIRKYFFQLSGISALYGEEQRPELVISGVHRYIRHPLYLGTLLVVWGLFLFFPLLSNLLAVVVITLYTVIGSWLEERKLLRTFGVAYEDYQRQTPMLIPRLRDSWRLAIFPSR